MPKRLYRSCKNRVLGGVAGGLSEYFEIDLTLIRLIFALLFFTVIGFFFYIAAWIVIPEDPSCETEKSNSGDGISENADHIRSSFRNGHVNSDNGRIIIGLIILGVGILTLLQTVFGYNFWNAFWPIVLVVIGLSIIVGKRR